MDSTRLKKLITIHAKVLNNPIYNFKSDEGNFLQLIKEDDKRIDLVSVGDNHKLILDAENLNHDSLDDFMVVNPKKLVKTLGFFNDEVSCVNENGVVNFRNSDNTRSVKLQNLLMSDSYKLNKEQISNIRNEVIEKGVSVGLREFKRVLKRMNSIASTEDDTDLKNLVDINFMTDGSVFSASNISAFQTTFDLGLDKNLVIDLPTSMLLIQVLNCHEDRDGLKIYIDEDYVTFLAGNDIVQINEVLEAVSNLDSMNEFKFEGKIPISPIELHKALFFCTTVADKDNSDDADIEFHDNTLTVKTYVTKDDDDSSQVDIILENVESDDFNISVSSVKDTVLPILKQMSEETILSISLENEVIKLDDGLNTAIIGITEI